MLRARQLGDGAEFLQPLALFLLGVFSSLPIGTRFLVGPALFFTLFRRALLLGAVLDPLLLGLLFSHLLRALLDDGLDHLLERSLIDTITLGVALGPDDVEHPFARR